MCCFNTSHSGSPGILPQSSPIKILIHSPFTFPNQNLYQDLKFPPHLPLTSSVTFLQHFLILASFLLCIPILAGSITRDLVSNCSWLQFTFYHLTYKQWTSRTHYIKLHCLSKIDWESTLSGRWVKPTRLPSSSFTLRQTGLANSNETLSLRVLEGRERCVTVKLLKSRHCS